MLEKMFKGLRSVLYGFSVAAMLLMLALTFGQVVTRYCFNWTPEWSEELARFLFVWVVFLGSALIMGESGHLAVEFVPNHYKGTKFGKVLGLVINLASYAFVTLLLVQGAKMAKTMTFQMSPGMNLPMSYVYVVIPVSSVLMLLYLVRDTVQILKGFANVPDQVIED
jgi:TRAP-type C4-dicarboxylate transport system permease small subunit